MFWSWSTNNNYMNDLILEVTQEDIDKGKRENCSLCPIALALMRKFNLDPSEDSLDHVSVGITMASIFPVIDKQHKSQYFYMPDEASEFIKNFDSKIPVKPFNFTLIPRS